MNIDNLYESMLNEAPLPDDWDKNMFSTATPYAKMIAYAKQRAEQIGKGSSRVAFLVQYQGRPTVIKVALNRKGLIQNQEEANLLGDSYLSSEEITIPMIDYDERNPMPTWIHTEYAQKITQSQLERFFGGVKLGVITLHLDSIQGRIRGNHPLPEKLYDNDLYQKLANVVSNYGLPASDLSRKANWGIYKGSPVIIDLGFTDISAKLYT